MSTEWLTRRGRLVLKGFPYYFVNKINTEGRRKRRRRLNLNGFPYNFVEETIEGSRRRHRTTEEEEAAGSEWISLLLFNKMNT